MRLIHSREFPLLISILLISPTAAFASYSAIALLPPGGTMSVPDDTVLPEVPVSSSTFGLLTTPQGTVPSGYVSSTFVPYLYQSGTYTALPLTGTTRTDIAATNAAGQIAGNLTNSTGQHAFFYNGTVHIADGPGQTSTVKALSAGGVVLADNITTGLAFTYAGGAATPIAVPTTTDGSIMVTTSGVAINAGGTVIGNAFNADASVEQAFWAAAGITHDLGSGETKGITSTGVISGNFVDPSGATSAFVFKPLAGTSTVIGNISAGVVESAVVAMNASGFITGTTTRLDSNASEEAGPAFLYNGSTSIALTPLDASTDADAASSPITINGNGAVLALSTSATGINLVEYSSTGAATDLGDIGSFDPSSTDAKHQFDDAGEILTTQSGHAEIIFSSGTRSDLNSLVTLPTGFTGYTLTDARFSADDSGIVATGVSGGNTVTFLLSPSFSAVPEPGTLGILVLGMLGMLRSRRRHA